MNIGRSNQKTDVYVCVDTGADLTLCDSLYLTYNFGPNALKHVMAMNKPPKLRSASSNYLKILGKVWLHSLQFEPDQFIVISSGKNIIKYLFIFAPNCE